MKDETVIKFTKYLLDFMYFAGMVVTVTLPWTVRFIADFFQYEAFQKQYHEVVIIYFVLGLLAILIIGELRKMFRKVLQNEADGNLQFFNIGYMSGTYFVVSDHCNDDTDFSFYHCRIIQ